MRMKGGKKGWTLSGLSKEAGNLLGATYSNASMFKVEETAKFPFWTHSVMRAKFRRDAWYEHKNYFLCALEIPLEGDMRFVQRERVSIVKPGTVYIIHLGEDAYMETGPSGCCRKISLIMAGSLHTQFMSGSGLLEHLEVKMDDMDGFLKTVFEIERLLAGKDKRNIPNIAGLTLNILMQLAAAIEPERPGLLTKALTIMDSSIAHPVPVKRLAAELSISVATLDRLFRKHLNKSPKQYYCDLRMQKALSMLSGTTTPVKTVANEAGFKSSIQFAAEFRSKYSCSPREFRKKSKG